MLLDFPAGCPHGLCTLLRTHKSMACIELSGAHPVTLLLACFTKLVVVIAAIFLAFQVLFILVSSL